MRNIPGIRFTVPVKWGSTSAIKGIQSIVNACSDSCVKWVFSRCVKYEEIYLNEYRDVSHLKQSLNLLFCLDYGVHFNRSEGELIRGRFFYDLNGSSIALIDNKPLFDKRMCPLKNIFFILILSIPIAVNAAGIGVTKSASKYFYGGGIGLSFGDMDTLSLSPMVGVNLSNKTSVGVSFSYVYRKYSLEQRDITTNDYATSLFTRYRLTPQYFLEADAEHLDNEFIRSDNSTDRRKFNSFLAGGGIRSSLGGNVSASLTVLYNFSYNDKNSPYSDPISIRGGIGVGF